MRLSDKHAAADLALSAFNHLLDFELDGATSGQL